MPDSNIVIPDQYYKEILSEIGYPVIKEDDLEFSREDIMDTCIRPAIRLLFTWFPKKNIQHYPVTSRFSIDFPSENTFGITDARLNTSAFGGATARSESAFVNHINYRQSTGSRYHSKYDYGTFEARVMERAEGKAAVNTYGSFKVDIDENERIATGYTNTPGELTITWAEMSTDFNEVPQSKLSDVLKLSKANVLRLFYMLRTQIEDDVNIQFNISDFQDRADTLEEDVMERWRSISKVVVLRG